MNPIRRWAPLYLVFQGVAGLAWWALLLAVVPVRDLFFPTTAGWEAGRSISVADICMFGFVSIAAGVTAWRNHRWAAPIGWATVGATSYATLVAVGWLAEPVGHWLGTAFMVPTLVATCFCVWVLHGAEPEGES